MNASFLEAFIEGINHFLHFFVVVLVILLGGRGRSGGGKKCEEWEKGGTWRVFMKYNPIRRVRGDKNLKGEERNHRWFLKIGKETLFAKNNLKNLYT